MIHLGADRALIWLIHSFRWITVWLCYRAGWLSVEYRDAARSYLGMKL